MPEYYDLLDILQDPDHEEYEETISWLKGHLKNYYPYDPEAFELEKVREQQTCLVHHAPGQTGKASCLNDVFSENKIFRREQEYQRRVIMVWGI